MRVRIKEISSVTQKLFVALYLLLIHYLLIHYLLMNLILKSHVWVEDPRKQEVTKPKSTGEPDYHEEEVLSSAPDQLHNCDEVQLPEHTHTRTDAVGDNPLDDIERVAVEPCDDVPTADAHTTTSESGNEETGQYQPPDLCTTTKSQLQTLIVHSVIFNPF